MELYRNGRKIEIGIISKEKSFFLAWKRLFPYIILMDQNLLFQKIKENNIDIVFFDIKEHTAPQELAFKDIRLTELSLKRLATVPIVAIGYEREENFLKDERNKAFHYPEFGYLYLSKPLKLYKFCKKLKELQRYTFSHIEFFKSQVRRFCEIKYIIRSIIHNTDEKSSESELKETFQKLSQIVENNIKEKIEECKREKFPRAKVNSLLKLLINL